MCHCEGYAWFSNSLLWDRAYKSENFCLESGIIFLDTDQLIKYFRLDKRARQFSIKNRLCKFVDKNNY